MKRLIPRLFAAGAIALAAASASAGVTIRTEPGPYGGTRVSTPWGTYIVQQRGDDLWVGTEEEFDHAHAVAVASEHGMQEFHTNDGPVKRYFIEAKMPKAQVGQTLLAEIDESIMFSVTPTTPIRRPAKPAGSEYVALSWVQTDPGETRLQILDETAHTSYQPYRCGFDKVSSTHYCEALVPREALVKPASLLFLRNKEKPGYLPVGTLAKFAAAGIQYHVKSLKEDGITVNPNDPDDDSYRDLKQLHHLDPEIAETVN